MPLDVTLTHLHTENLWMSLNAERESDKDSPEKLIFRWKGHVLTQVRPDGQSKDNAGWVMVVDTVTDHIVYYGPYSEPTEDQKVTWLQEVSACERRSLAAHRGMHCSKRQVFCLCQRRNTVTAQQRTEDHSERRLFGSLRFVLAYAIFVYAC